MDLFDTFQKLGIALGLGLLVGLQREYVVSPLAGIRTFPVITVFGAVCALLAKQFNEGWIVGLGVIALAALVVAGNVMKLRGRRKFDPGITTEVAILLMYGVGAYLVVGHALVAVAIAGGLAVLLQWKEPLHGFVRKMGPADIKAIMQFALISLVILPVLPDEEYGPYGAFNPRKSWLMVVLIVAISLGAYVAYKWFGERIGTILGGGLGGLISSTATTVSYARRARAAPDSTALVAAVIMIASTVAVARVLVEIAVVAPNTLWAMAPPLGVLLGWMVILSVGLYLLGRNDGVAAPTQDNPAELRSALLFGALYALVNLAIAAARDYYGEQGLYGVAILSGLHDMDAITLSTAQLADNGAVSLAVGWRVIMTAALSNLVMKAAIAGALGHWRLLTWIGSAFGLALLGGVILLVVWPG